MERDLTAELDMLTDEFNRYKAELDQWRREAISHRSELDSRLILLHDEVAVQNDQIRKVRKDFGDILTAWSGAKGAVLFFWAVGRVVKWLTAIVLLGSSIIYFLNGLAPPPGK